MSRAQVLSRHKAAGFQVTGHLDNSAIIATVLFFLLTIKNIITFHLVKSICFLECLLLYSLFIQSTILFLVTMDAKDQQKQEPEGAREGLPTLERAGLLAGATVHMSSSESEGARDGGAEQLLMGRDWSPQRQRARGLRPAAWELTRGPCASRPRQVRQQLAASGTSEHS